MNVEEHLGTVTQKGQVTIPLAVRKLLGVKSRDRVTFRVTEGRVELAAQMTLEAAYGMPTKTRVSYDRDFDRFLNIHRREP